MKYLLDTHTFLWYFQEDNKLNPDLVGLLEELDNNLYLSIVSLWEIGIKINIGKLQLGCTFQELLSFINQVNIEVLPITSLDIEYYLNLPLHHRDPFDRILVAQAVNNQLILISRDAVFDNYSIQRLW